jgi:hypothetical protein
MYFLAVVATALFWSPSAPGTDAIVKVAAGRLSINASGQPLREVLREVRLRTGIPIDGGDDLTAPLTVDIKDLPIADALRLLLAEHSYMIVGPSGRNVSQVVILGRRGPAARHEVPPALVRAFADADPAVRIEAVERLGERRDAESQALVRRALADTNEAVRAVARVAIDAQEPQRGPMQAVRADGSRRGSE